jgi:hypothetical protein
MQRTVRQAVAAGLAVGGLGIAAAAFDRFDPPFGATPPARPAAAPTMFETLTLLQYGQGAFDWMLPDTTGDPNDRNRRHAH